MTSINKFTVAKDGRTFYSQKFDKADSFDTAQTIRVYDKTGKPSRIINYNRDGSQSIYDQENKINYFYNKNRALVKVVDFDTKNKALNFFSNPLHDYKSNPIKIIRAK